MDGDNKSLSEEEMEEQYYEKVLLHYYYYSMAVAEFPQYKSIVYKFTDTIGLVELNLN